MQAVKQLVHPSSGFQARRTEGTTRSMSTRAIVKRRKYTDIIAAMGEPPIAELGGALNQGRYIWMHYPCGCSFRAEYGGSYSHYRGNCTESHFPKSILR